MIYHLYCLFSGKRRYNIKLWKTFTDCFNCLPVAAIVDEKIFCCHGGLSPDLQSMEQIRRIMRPTDVPDQGLLCDLLWSDPDKVRHTLPMYLLSRFNIFITKTRYRKKLVYFTNAYSMCVSVRNVKSQHKLGMECYYLNITLSTFLHFHREFCQHVNFSIWSTYWT